MRPPLFFGGLVLAALLLPAAARAAEPKLGYVRFKFALGEVEEGKAAQAVLKKDFEEKQRVISKDEEELKKLGADFEKQRLVMNEDARREKENELQRRSMELQGKAMRLQKELSDRERELVGGISEKLNAIILEMAEAEGFTFVFNEAGLLYAQPSLDLTNELIRKYNARHKPGAETAKKGESKKPEGDKKGAKK